MNRTEPHPDSVALDRLRAGLLDDDPVQKTAIERHLRQCEVCRRNYDWPGSLAGVSTQIDARLDQLRHRALQAPAGRRPRHWQPLAVAAGLALVAVGLFQLVQHTESQPPQVAASSQKVPDLYEDLDFYLWLADHKGTSDSST